jgi:hypothetical protein
LYRTTGTIRRWVFTTFFTIGQPKRDRGLSGLHWLDRNKSLSIASTCGVKKFDDTGPPPKDPRPPAPGSTPANAIHAHSVSSSESRPVSSPSFANFLPRTIGKSKGQWRVVSQRAGVRSQPTALYLLPTLLWFAPTPCIGPRPLTSTSEG